MIITGKRDPAIGKKLKNIFMEKTPGLKDLVNTVNKAYQLSMERDGRAWIPGIDGRMIFVDSPHKSLNYLLQSMEAITCKGAVAMSMDRLEAEGIEYIPNIFMHDELEICVREEHAERAAVICQEAFRDAPKKFGVMIMDGAAKIGDNWYDVH